MKPKSALRGIAAAIALATPVLAANRYWDGGSTDILANGDNISTGGAGTWNTTILNWDAGASPHVAWNNANNDTAILGGGTAGTVSVGTAITVGGIQFTRDGYTLSGSTITLASGAVINASVNNTTSTISSILTGSSGFTKTGAGRLILTGANNYSGNTSVSGGMVDFANISLAGFGGGSGRNINVAANGSVQRNTLDNAFLNRLVETSSEITVMTGSTANNLDFSSGTGANLPNAFLGSWKSNGGKSEYNGTLTPASDHYRFGSSSSSGFLGIRSVLTDIGGAPRGLIIGGNRVNLVAANTFTGDTTIRSGGRLTLGNNLALQNSALDVGSSGGNFACAAGSNGAKITGETEAASPTFGGLKGSRNLLSVFTNSASNNETNLASTAVTGFTLNVGSGKTCTYSGIIAEFAPNTTLTKTGAGTQSLTGNNSYKGATTVSGGTLSVSFPYFALQSPVTIGSGATLQLNFSGTVQVTTLVINGVTKTAGVYNNSNSSPYITGTGSITVVDLDADDDGMPDSYELANTTPPSATGLNPGDDLDSDGRTNLQEYQTGTNPNVADSDGDGLNDGVETNTGTWVSATNTGTNPIKADTDGDGFSDGVETNTGTWAGATNTGTNPNKADTDLDGLKDGAETNTGTYVSATNTGTSPLDTDTDDDNAGDWYEVGVCYTNPVNPASKPKVPYPLPKPDGSTGATNKPVKVFIIMGQSNMVGQGNIDPIGTLGTLATTVKQEGKFPNLLDNAGTNWLPRNDVTYKGVVAATGLPGPLTPGHGGSTASIGPELGFGQIMGYHFDEPVLLLKTSEGGKDLGYQLLPPGSPSYVSGGYNYAGYGVTPKRWTVGSSPIPDGTTGGEQYDKTVAAAKGVLNSFNTLYPQYATQGYVIAGFVWFQGYNDIVGYQPYVDRYEMNLANYIRAIRTEFSAPNAPFVVCTCGFDGAAASGNTLAVINAQLAVSQYEEFAGNVKSVDTRGYWRAIAQSPKDEGYHYNRNAETFMLVGDAAGRAMLDLLPATSAYDAWAANYPAADLTDKTADHDKDGLANLIEFAFGLNPTLPDAANMPQPQRVGNELVISFTPPSNVSGITYGAQSSETMAPGDWHPLPDTGTPPVREFKITAGAKSRDFVRLTVTGRAEELASPPVDP